jgi:hypothetical protein
VEARLLEAMKAKADAADLLAINTILPGKADVGDIKVRRPTGYHILVAHVAPL